jgi:hypothetical protein
MIKMSVNSVKLLIIALSQVNNLLAVSWQKLTVVDYPFGILSLFFRLISTKWATNSSMVIVSLTDEAGFGEVLVSKLVYKLCSSTDRPK